MRLTTPQVDLNWCYPCEDIQSSALKSAAELIPAATLEPARAQGSDARVHPPDHQGRGIRALHNCFCTERATLVSNAGVSTSIVPSPSAGRGGRLAYGLHVGWEANRQPVPSVAGAASRVRTTKRWSAQRVRAGALAEVSNRLFRPGKRPTCAAVHPPGLRRALRVFQQIAPALYHPGSGMAQDATLGYPAGGLRT